MTNQRIVLQGKLCLWLLDPTTSQYIAFDRPGVSSCLRVWLGSPLGRMSQLVTEVAAFAESILRVPFLRRHAICLSFRCRLALREFRRLPYPKLPPSGNGSAHLVRCDGRWMKPPASPRCKRSRSQRV